MSRYRARLAFLPGGDRWVAVAVLVAVLAAYSGVALGVAHLGGTPHGRSVHAAAPFAILPR